MTDRASRPASSPGARRHAGFTLIEMMVVMVLLGLLTTLALPAMQRWHDAVQARAQTMGVVEALRSAAFAAGANRHRLQVDAQSFVTAVAAPAAPAASAASDPFASDPFASRSPSDDPMAPPEAEPAASAPAQTERWRDRARVLLPSGWQVDEVTPAAFLANGLCAPGRVGFKTGAGVRLAVEIHGPTCSIGLAEAAATARR